MPKSALFIQLFRQNTDLWQTQTQTDGQTDRHRAIASTRASPVWARERCRISPPRFLAECCKRQLNQGSFVLLYFRLSTFSDLYWVCLSVFSCTVLFVGISQVIGCEYRLRNDLYCVEWGVKLYSNQPTNQPIIKCSLPQCKNRSDASGHAAAEESVDTERIVCLLARFIHIQISLCRWQGCRRRRRGEYYLYTMTRRRPHDQIIQTQTVPGWAVIFVLHEPSNLLGLEYLTRSRTSMYSFLAWLLAHK